MRLSRTRILKHSKIDMATVPPQYRLFRIGTVTIALGAVLVGGCRQSSPFTHDVLREMRETGPSPLAAHEPIPPHLQPLPQPEDGQLAFEITSPLSLSVERAVLLALHNNRALRVQQLEPMIVGTFEELERARFDPVISAEVVTAYDRRRVLSTTTGELLRARSDEQFAGVAIEQEFPTGTGLGISMTGERLGAEGVSDFYATGPAITLTQALLRGANWQANVAAIEQARLNTLASEYQLRGFIEALVAQVETTFWEYHFAQQEINIFESSLALAEQHLAETRRRVEVGTVAATEIAAAHAEVARRQEELINARSNERRLQLRLLRLINPGFDDGWNLELLVEGGAEFEPAPLGPVDEHIQLAERQRPELNEARMLLERERLEVVQTRDGLLPRLDFFVTLGKTGYARSFGDAWSDIGGRNFDLQAGLLFSYPLGNRAAQAEHERARLTRQQAGESLHNLAQLISLDVREAHLEVERTQEQIGATRATRELREETLRAETEKFRVGTSTAFLVAQSQRDLLESQIAEVRAVVNYRQALIDLYRLDGTLLQRRAIAAPGERVAW